KSPYPETPDSSRVASKRAWIFPGFIRGAFTAFKGVRKSKSSAPQGQNDSRRAKRVSSDHHLQILNIPRDLPFNRMSGRMLSLALACPNLYLPPHFWKPPLVCRICRKTGHIHWPYPKPP